MEINVFFRKHWGEVESFSGDERFFSMDDLASVQDLFDMSSENRYKYGKIELAKDYFKLIDEECELDYFFSTIQFAKADIYSGQAYAVDNSYFKIEFLFEKNFLYIKHQGKHIKVAAQEFNQAFVASGTKYYSLLEKYHKEDPDNYAFLRENLQQWLA
jgi:hypothetical protein